MRVGIIGWRGMVGSVLLQRMAEEGDFAGLQCHFFSTSSPGSLGPDVGEGAAPLHDAFDLKALAANEVLISCQGGEYTKAVYSELRQSGFKGIWIDAASALRMHKESVLILDPVNGDAIREQLANKATTFIGANCTVSLMLMGLIGLIRSEQVEWISSMTYQAASGAGAKAMRELVNQMKFVGDHAQHNGSPTQLDRSVSKALLHPDFPTAAFSAPLAASAIPWVDRLVEGGQTREEWKASVEANKLLGRQHSPLPIDGLCVRIGAMRCHAQALTIKLKQPIALDEVEAMIRDAHPWSSVVPNEKQATLAQLTPAAVAGTLKVPVGRLRPMNLGPDFLTAFTVGDQLLWGAAEPLRRMLQMVREHRGQ